MNGRLDLARLDCDFQIIKFIEDWKKIHLDDLSGKISYDSDLKELFTNCVRKRVPQTTNDDNWSTIYDLTIELFDKATLSTIPLVNKCVIPPYIDCDAARVTVAYSWLQSAQDNANIKLFSIEYDDLNAQYDQASHELSVLESDLQNIRETPAKINLQSSRSQKIHAERNEQAIDDMNEVIEPRRVTVNELSKVS
jgi:hypothetical protein